MQTLYHDFSQVDFYQEARDSYLSQLIPSYPEPGLLSLIITFSFNRAKNAPLVHAILDALPDDCSSIEANNVSVNLPTESQIVEQYAHIIDLLAVIRNWKTLRISIDGQILDWLGMRYLFSFICDRNGLREPEFSYISIKDLKKKYLSGSGGVTRQRVSNNLDLLPLDLAGDKEEVSKKVADRYKELYLQGFEVKEIASRPLEVILIIEDALIVDFCMVCTAADEDDGHGYRVEEYTGDEEGYVRCQIQELTPNKLFNFNYSAFRRCFTGIGSCGVDFLKFHGVGYYRNDLNRSKAVIARYPELRLEERLSAYEGDSYHFIILEMEGADGKVVRGIGYTKGKVHTFILKICKDLEERNSRSLELNGLQDNGVLYIENKPFVVAFLSWKGKKKRWRLENKFAYCYIDLMIKNESSLYTLPEKILREANEGIYDNLEKGTYSKPVNRWKSEELVYKTAKKLYGDYQVVYQFSPHYLSTGKGTMSYDVYICGLKVAIEYQGIQHFEPIDYFGGAENHETQVERDKLKMKLSKENGVHLVYVNYWEDITPILIREKVATAISEAVIPGEGQAGQ